ncbi:MULTISPECIES: hypothetical protein [unclassified Acinetobacter]|uniref:hypothetical protein n=1 Tax=unclassified Acinetobacter TaxID=196816 RepID=UPI00244AF9C4|nr:MULTISPECIES: hypothetical protein [unclassified Acinetobacter]MDH0031533.1 hypothetical protein [Acinetobacter sp. GD04021]MDH0886876.1 hypothetical protein [Acinetobacter sp. GD03873]MDH1083311.1 hypothetical protein [Acinetobacter sp. GD03983]MDH2190192.1 hypothetical protein [Acinetobacter sp. GD03645]MDH2203329.1 hypothetical protein [Acinetobacter sp. GD03647]
MATEKTYTHAIFSIADPLVKNHIEQAIYSCKFRLKFPTFYMLMVNSRSNIDKQLSFKLIEAYLKYNNEVMDDKLEENIGIILEDRRFLDNAIGFIQTGRLLLPDLFLISNEIMTLDEIRELFSQVSISFWEEASKILHSNRENYGKDEILSYLNENGLYLPNLFPLLGIEDLFLNFLPIHLSYGKFNSSKDQKSLAKLPTSNECYEILAPLYSHASPLYFDSSSYLDYSTEVNSKLTLTHFVLQMDLDEPPENLPYLLRDFLINYQSRRLDFMRKGNNNEYHSAQIDEINNLSAVAKEILSVLDKFSNQRIGNRKEIHSLGYDAVLNAILALFFIEYHCKLIFKDHNLNVIDLKKDTDHSGNDKINNMLKDDKEVDEFPCGISLKFSTVYESFVNNLEKILLQSEKFHIAVSPPSRGKRKIQSIQITLKEEVSNSLNSSKKRQPQTLNLHVNSLKKTIREFLKKRIPEVEAFVQF